MDVLNLGEVLALLASGTAIGAVIAFLFEQLEWFQQLGPKVKRGLIFGLCLALPIAAWLAQLGMGYVPLPEAWQGWIEAIWLKLAVGFTAWMGSQGVHRWDVEKRANSA